MNKFEKMKNITYKIALPIIASIFLCYLIYYILLKNFFTIESIDISIFNLKFTKGLVKEHASKIKFLISFIITIILFYQFIRNNRRKHKQFIESNKYGDYPYTIYFVSKLLGYRCIDIKLKPIPIQFKLLNNNFECYDSSDYGDDDDEYDIKSYGRLCKNKPINIMIGDTYGIERKQLPEECKDFFTVIVNRKNINTTDGERIKSNNLIKILNSEINEDKKYTKKFNLFLNTPGITNKKIYDKIFNTQRDNYILKIYYTDKNFKFLNKYERIKC